MYLKELIEKVFFLTFIHQTLAQFPYTEIVNIAIFLYILAQTIK